MSITSLLSIARTVTGLVKSSRSSTANLPVLVIEDSIADGEIVRHTLKKLKVESVVVHTLEGARDLISNRSFRMVVLDLVFPRGNGVDFCNELFMEYPNLAVLILTGHPPEIEVGANETRTLLPGRVWLISTKGVETGSLEASLKISLKLANGHNGHTPIPALAAIFWVACSASVALGLFLHHVSKLLENLNIK